MTSTGFLNQGFLSDAATELKRELSESAVGEFSLALDTNTYAHSLIEQLNHERFTETTSQKSLGAFSLLRASEQYQSVVILCQNGFKISAQSAVRGLLETTFFVILLRYDHARFLELLRSDNSRSRKSLAKALKKNQTLTKKQSNLIEAAIKKIIVEHNKHSTIMDIAEKSIISGLYPYYKYLSNAASHFSADSLNRHLFKDSEGHWSGFDYGLSDSATTKENLLQATKIYHILILAYLEIMDASSSDLLPLVNARVSFEAELQNK